MSVSLVKLTVLSLLAHLYYELDIERDAIHKPSLIKQETGNLNDVYPFCCFLAVILFSCFVTNSYDVQVNPGHLSVMPHRLY